MDELWREFQRPGPEYSAVPLWFWFGQLNAEELTRQVDEMVDKGVYGAFMHARPFLKTPYLEQEWWDAVAAVVEHSDKVGFHPWLYDEYAWPSGTAGSVFRHGFQKPSRVLERGRQHMAQGLRFREITADGPGMLDVRIPGIPDSRVAVLLVRMNERGQAELDRMTDVSRNWGDSVRLPEGRWKLMVFYSYEIPHMVNYLSPETIRLFIELTHEEYKKRFGAYFGGRIPGLFFDEIFNAGHPIVWTDGFDERFLRWKGYDIKAYLPLLICDGDDEERTRAVRRDYFSVLSELYEEAFFRQISEWCEKHGLQLTGHTEEHLRSHPLRQGDYFNTQRHLHIPGADCHDYRYRYPRKITYVEPKGAVGVARLYGRKRVLSEAMGGGGWATTLQEFKRGINVLAAMGINFFTLHGFYSDIDHQGSQADWPASFFIQNPYWKYFKIFADYISRISYMGTVGKPVCPVGILYPIGAMWENTVGGRLNETGERIDRDYHALLNHLLEHQIDADLIDETGVQSADVSSGRLAKGDAAFTVLFVHKRHRLADGMRDKLKKFEESGGTIVFYGDGDVPESGFRRFVDAGTDRGRWLSAAKSGGGCTLEVIGGSAKDVFYYKREKDGTPYYFLVNGSAEVKELTVDFHATGTPYLWDPETGGRNRPDRAETIPAEGKTRIDLTLQPDQAVFVVFESGETTARPERAEACPEVSREIPFEAEWKAVPAGRELDRSWGTGTSETVLAIPVGRFRSPYDGEWRDIRFQNRDGEPGGCGRYLSNWKANWITRRPSWNCDSAEPVLYFRKKVFIDKPFREARVCMTAVNRFELYVNGRKAGEGVGWDRPAIIDLTDSLTVGENTVAVKVMNDTPATGPNMLEVESFDPTWLTSLLFHMRIVGEQFEQDVVSDSGWIVAKRAEENWFMPDCRAEETAVAVDPKEKRSFGDSDPDRWLYAWERGRPPLLPWGHLPLFGERVKFPVPLEYEVLLPPGATRLYTPQVRGEMTVSVNGQPIGDSAWEQGHMDLEPSGSGVQVRIRVKADDFSCGVTGPIEVAVSERAVSLEPWDRWNLDWFSGRVIYRNAFRLSREEAGRSVELDLGDVRHHAEVWINGRHVRTLLWPPYRTDISAWVREGINEVCIIVSNLIANRMRRGILDEGRALGWNRYWMEDNIDRDIHNLVSGLLGPVTVRVR